MVSFNTWPIGLPHSRVGTWGKRRYWV